MEEPTKQQRDNAEVWHVLAVIRGYNELAKEARTPGEKIYFRLARDEAEKEYALMGGEIRHTGPESIVVVHTSPPFIVMTPADIELMRKAVAEYDAAHAGEGGGE